MWIQEKLKDVQLKIQEHEETISFDIMAIKYDLILGMKWLRRHNPQID